MIDQILGHHRILEKLGSGGVGVLYKAGDTLLNRNSRDRATWRMLSGEGEANRKFPLAANHVREKTTSTRLLSAVVRGGFGTDEPQEPAEVLRILPVSPQTKSMVLEKGE